MLDKKVIVFAREYRKRGQKVYCLAVKNSV